MKLLTYVKHSRLITKKVAKEFGVECGVGVAIDVALTVLIEGITAVNLIAIVPITITGCIVSSILKNR